MPPRWHNDYELLAAVACHIRDRRIEGYPELVEAGRLKPATAHAGIRIANALAADWVAIAALEPAPDWIDNGDDRGAWKFERVAMLTDTAIRTRAAADRSPYDFEAVGYADAVDTLLWWESAQPGARWFADTNIALHQWAARNRVACSETVTKGVAA